MEHFNWGLFWYLEIMTLIITGLFSYGPGDDSNAIISWAVFIPGTIGSILLARYS